MLSDLPNHSFISCGTQTEAQLVFKVKAVDASTQTDATKAKPPLHGRLKKSDAASAASVTSLGSRDSGAIAADGRSIRPTPRRKRLGHIREIMRHWHLDRTTQFCCPWHQTIMALEAVLDKLKSEQCNPLWSAYSGFQCEWCFAMNDGGTVDCRFCGDLSKRGRQAAPKAGGDASQQPLERLEVKPLDAFPITPMETCFTSFMKVARHWNQANMDDVEPCCTFHSHALVAISIAEHMGTVPCGTSTWKCSDWSCTKCFALNDEASDSCGLCGEGLALQLLDGNGGPRSGEGPKVSL